MIKVIEYRSGEHRETKKEQPILKSSHDIGLISEDEIEDITTIIRRLWQRVDSYFSGINLMAEINLYNIDIKNEKVTFYIHVKAKYGKLCSEQQLHMIHRIFGDKYRGPQLEYNTPLPYNVFDKLPDNMYSFFYDVELWPL